MIAAADSRYKTGESCDESCTPGLAHWSSTPYNAGMTKKRLPFSDELRRAVNACGLSRYRIAKELQVSESLLSRFMSGMWLGQETMDALAELLDLHVSVGGRAGEASAAEGQAKQPPQRKGKARPEK